MPMQQYLAPNDQERLLSDLALWSMRKLSASSTSIMDCPVASRIAVEQIRSLYNAYLRRGSKGTKLPPRPTLLKAIQKIYPTEDPVLLFWRVWISQKEGPLAPHSLLRPAITSLSNSAQSLEFGTRRHTSNTIREEALRLCSKIRRKGRLTHQDVSQAWTRIQKCLQDGPDVSQYGN